MPKYEFTEEDAPEEATDYRAFFDSKVLRVWHLAGAEKTLTIEKVKVLTTEMSGEKKKQPELCFKGIKLPFALNKTNAATIAQLYGNAPRDWIGKRVTLYPTTTQFGRNTVDCVRVKPEKPKGKSPAKEPEARELGIRHEEQLPPEDTHVPLDDETPAEKEFRQ